MNFLKAGDVAKCPVCGFQYQLSGDALSAQTSPGLPAIGIFGLVLRVFLTMLALAAIGLAVVFAGCALILRQV